jgi:hypothetical protein
MLIVRNTLAIKQPMCLSCQIIENIADEFGNNPAPPAGFQPARYQLRGANPTRSSIVFAPFAPGFFCYPAAAQI